MTTPAEYFCDFLAAPYLQQPLLDGYDGFSATFTISFRDLPGECWLVSIEHGRITDVRAGADPEQAAVRYVVDLPTFTEIVAGKLSPQKAFFLRRTDIRGDLFAGMKVARILGEFFAKFPYGPA